MIVAVVGCLHGRLEFLYEELAQWEQYNQQKVDLIICCGDFQSLRDKNDLDALECPPKYKELGQFHKFYNGEKRAPILTLFVGGNHEASNYLRDLFYGGWVTENIYYLGSSGVVQVRKGKETLRVAGISGIFKGYDYRKGYCEQWPYVDDKNGLRSIYHIREYDVQKLKLYEDKKLDICVSHDWPTIVTQRGHKNAIKRLQQIKPHFKEIETGTFGAECLSEIIQETSPRYWFAAHMHVKFNVTIPNDNNQETEFLALDKPLPGRKYLEIFEIKQDTQKLKSILQFNQEEKQVVEKKQPLSKPKPEDEVYLEYDPLWIAITQETHDHMSVSFKKEDYRYLNKGNFEIKEGIQERLEKLLAKEEDLRIYYDESQVKAKYERVNPQTKLFIERFGLDFRLYEDQQQMPKKAKEQDGEESKEEEKKFYKSYEEGKDDKNSKRTYTQAFQYRPKQKQVVKDANEIDLDI